MAEPSKRIIVDGVDFANVFQFPRIFRAVAMAMQPARLVIALLMVTALITFGRVWDASTAPKFRAEGFLHDPLTEEQLNAAQLVYHQELRAWAAEAPADLDHDLDGRDVLAELEDAYLAAMDEIDARGLDEEGEGKALRDLAIQFAATATAVEDVRPRGTYEALAEHLTKMFTVVMRGVASFQPVPVTRGGYSMLIHTPVTLWHRDKAFAVIYGLIFVVVLALGGGALSRMAAAEVATGERLRIRDAIDFALESWPRLLLTPLLPLIIVALLCLVLAVGGAVFFLPWLDVVGGVMYGIALLLGFVIAVLLIGYAAGFSLLIPAVAVENCDAADAQHRAYAYVLSRPFHLLGYGLTALIGLTLGFLLVAFCAMVVLNVTSSMAGFWTNNAALNVPGDVSSVFDLGPDYPRVPPATAHARAAAAGVLFWHTFVVSVVVAYVAAYYFAASTIVYLLIRKKCDGQDTTEIWRPGMIPGTFTPAPETGRSESSSP